MWGKDKEMQKWNVLNTDKMSCRNVYVDRYITHT